MDHDAVARLIVTIETSLKNGEQVLIIDEMGCFSVLAARMRHGTLQCLLYRPGKDKLSWHFAGDDAAIVIQQSEHSVVIDLDEEEDV